MKRGRKTDPAKVQLYSTMASHARVMQMAGETQKGSELLVTAKAAAEGSTMEAMLKKSWQQNHFLAELRRGDAGKAPTWLVVTFLVFNTLLTSLQFYWSYLIVQGAIKLARGEKDIDKDR